MGIFGSRTRYEAPPMLCGTDGKVYEFTVENMSRVIRQRDDWRAQYVQRANELDKALDDAKDAKALRDGADLQLRDAQRANRELCTKVEQLRGEVSDLVRERENQVAHAASLEKRLKEKDEAIERYHAAHIELVKEADAQGARVRSLEKQLEALRYSLNTQDFGVMGVEKQARTPTTPREEACDRWGSSNPDVKVESCVLGKETLYAIATPFKWYEGPAPTLQDQIDQLKAAIKREQDVREALHQVKIASASAPIEAIEPLIRGNDELRAHILKHGWTP